MIIYKIKNYNKQILAILLLNLIFLISLSIEYSKYLDLTSEEIYETEVEVLNIYEKINDNIFRLRADNFEFFTKIENSTQIAKGDTLNIAIISKYISFYDYLKGFYAKSIYFDKLDKKYSFKHKIIDKINLNHNDLIIQELFQALFLAIPISSELRQICTNYGISHLIALSGFHLAVLSFVIYWIFYFPYSYFHSKYFSYRNKKFDLLMITIFFLSLI